MSTKQFKFFSQNVFVISLLLGVSQNALSHTRLEIPVGTEGVRITNNIVISHGCTGNSVIASSSVFPDGVDSIVKVNGTVSTDLIDVHLSNWGNLNQKVWDPGAFKAMGEKTDGNGNVVGFWVADGKMPADMGAYVKYRASAAIFESTSCAASVKVVIPIADICQITNIAGFTDAAVNLWTPAVGSNYDGPGLHGYDSPASFTIVRDTTNNPLDPACGEGDAVELIPSAAQINRDMPYFIKGKQIWPKP